MGHLGACHKHYFTFADSYRLDFAIYVAGTHRIGNKAILQ